MQNIQNSFCFLFFPLCLNKKIKKRSSEICAWYSRPEADRHDERLTDKGNGVTHRRLVTCVVVFMSWRGKKKKAVVKDRGTRGHV